MSWKGLNLQSECFYYIQSLPSQSPSTTGFLYKFDVIWQLINRNLITKLGYALWSAKGGVE